MGSESSNSEVRKRLIFVQTKEFLEQLSKHQLEDILKAVNKERKRRFKRRKERKYGNINKGFVEEELTKFFTCCRNPKANLAFRIMANLGLRVGEVASIKIDDIDITRRKLRLFTEKAHTGDSLYLHDEIYDLLKEWINTHYDAIIAHRGYILYSDTKRNDSTVLGLSRYGFTKYSDGEKLKALGGGKEDSLKPSKDALIAETALANDLILLSNDKQHRNRLTSQGVEP